MYFLYKNEYKARSQDLTPVILATWEAKTRRTTIQSQPGQTVQFMRPYLETIQHKKG
jgi:hypothetical protein